MKPNVRIVNPVTMNLKSLFREPLPQEPVILQMAVDEWNSLSKNIRISKRKIREDAKGLFVIPDPFGGYLGFFACAAGSKKGVACIPEIVRSRGAITFGNGCRCISGADPVDKPVPSEETCSLGLSITGGLVCVGNCSSGKRCELVRIPTPGGRAFFTCICS